MQNDLKDRIARLKALNEKRTHTLSGDTARVTCINKLGITMQIDMCVAQEDILAGNYPNMHDGQFYAAAPEMMAVITELEAELDRVKALLDSPEMVEAFSKIDKAIDMVHALCQPKGSDGARQWVMSIPARPDYDPDIVIADALQEAKAAIAAIRGKVR